MFVFLSFCYVEVELTLGSKSRAAGRVRRNRRAWRDRYWRR